QNPSPRGLGIEDTLLCSFDGGKRRLFQVPAANVPDRHPYLQNELLTKIFNHLTTRSNVFAVWLTVGFFEVTDDSVRPVKLGAEVGRAEGHQVRHRMFAIIDRTKLQTRLPDDSVTFGNPGPQPRFQPRASQVVPYFSIIH